jgi:hypothetical protein
MTNVPPAEGRRLYQRHTRRRQSGGFTSDDCDGYRHVDLGDNPHRRGDQSTPSRVWRRIGRRIGHLRLIRLWRPVTDAQTAGYHAENAGFYRDPAGYHRGPSRSVSYRFPTQPVFCGLNALGVGYRATALEGRLQPKWHHAGRSAAITHAVRVDNPHPRADTPQKSLCLAGLGSRPAPKTARKCGVSVRKSRGIKAVMWVIAEGQRATVAAYTAGGGKVATPPVGGGKPRLCSS